MFSERAWSPRCCWSWYSERVLAWVIGCWSGRRVPRAPRGSLMTLSRHFLLSIHDSQPPRGIRELTSIYDFGNPSSTARYSFSAAEFFKVCGSLQVVMAVLLVHSCQVNGVSRVLHNILVYHAHLLRTHSQLGYV
jgi:hypothetical protein